MQGSGRVSRDLCALPGDLRLLHPCDRPARHPRGDARGARGVLGEALRRARVRHLDGQFPRHPGGPRGQQLISDFLARKIRQRVTDPAVAEKLIPKITASARAACRSKAAITRSTTSPTSPWSTSTRRRSSASRLTGIKTSDAEYAFDIIIYATGFDAITGAFDRIDVAGSTGCRSRTKWQDGPQTFGILVDGFPNMLMVMGPHAGLGNFPRAAEYSADWVTRLIRFARDRGLTRIAATAAGANAWTDHVIAASEGLLSTEVDSWMTGINRNVEGKQVRRIMRYSGGHPAFARAATRWRRTGTATWRWLNACCGAAPTAARACLRARGWAKGLSPATRLQSINDGERSWMSA